MSSVELVKGSSVVGVKSLGTVEYDSVDDEVRSDELLNGRLSVDALGLLGDELAELSGLLDDELSVMSLRLLGVEPSVVPLGLLYIELSELLGDEIPVKDSGLLGDEISVDPSGDEPLLELLVLISVD